MNEFPPGVLSLKKHFRRVLGESILLQSVNWVKIVRGKRRLSLSEWMMGPLEDRIGGQGCVDAKEAE